MRDNNITPSLRLRPHATMPSALKPSCVVEEVGGWAKGVDISCPASSLVTLWAIGWSTEEVAPHGPTDVLMELVESVV